MSRSRTLSIFLLLIGFFSAVKLIVLLNKGQLEQSFYLLCVTIWAVWIACAVLKDWNLPAPFGFKNGQNQIARIGYLVLVTGIFIFVAL